MQKIFNRRTFLFLLVLIPTFALIIAALFHEPIFFSAFEWYAKHTCKKCFGGELVAQRIYRQDNRWIMENPRIFGGTTDGAGGTSFQAKRLEVKYAPNIWNRQIDLDIVLVEPQIELGDQSFRGGGWLPLLESKSQFLTVNGSLAIEKGMFSMKDMSTSSSMTHTISLDGKIHFAPLFEAAGTFNFGDKPSQTKQLKVAIQENGSKQLRCELDCHQADLATLTHVVGLFNSHLQSLIVSQGTLDGALTLIFSEDEKPYMEGSLNVTDLAFLYPSLEVKGNIAEAKMALNQNNDSDTVQKPLGVLEIIKGGSLELFNDGALLCKIQNLLGGVYLDSPESARVAFDGLYSYLGQTQALHIEGQSNFSENSNASLDLACRLASSKRENVFAHFIARKLDEQKGYAEIEIKNFTQEEFHFLQTVMGRYFPVWNQFHVRSGSVDASMMALIDRSRFRDFKIEKIAGRNLELAILPWNLYCKASSATGNLTIDPANPNILETLDSSVTITDGQLRFLRSGHQRLGFLDIQAMLSVKHGILQKTQIKGGFAGLQGSVEVDWSSPNEVMRLNFTGGTDDIALLLSENIGRGIKKKFGEDLLKIEAGVKHTLGA